MDTSTNALAEAVRRRLEQALPEQAEAAGLPPVVEFLDYDPSVPQAAKCPQVWVDISRADRGNVAAFGGPNSPQARNRTLLVGVTASGQDEGLAVRHLRAFADLTVALLEGDQTAGGQGFRVQWISTDYSPSFRQGSALFKLCVMTFSIPRWAGLGKD